MNNAYISALNNFAETDWLSAVESLLPTIHEVDRNAVQIWFRFYPLDLQKYLEAAEDIDRAKLGLALQGSFGLADKIDSSHNFLYGHRFWPHVHSAIVASAEAGENADDLTAAITNIAQRSADAGKTDVKLTTAIAAAGLMTLVQVGLDAFKAAKGEAAKPSGQMVNSPDQIVEERGKDDSQGIFGFLRTVDKSFSVNFNALKNNGKFKIINDEEIASASQNDRSQKWQELDSRCWEGPVPIECTSASCGTCWVGVVGGQEKLEEPSRRERTQMSIFGYNQPDDKHPFIRLACQAKAHGNVHIVIPPWNAVFGKKVRGNVRQVELEPVTTSAKKLRETIESAMSGE